MPSKLLFLPGASGHPDWWQPVADLLTCPAPRIHVAWPGFGPTPANPEIRGIDDLIDRVVAQIVEPTALIAQSMGGVIAMHAALRKPELVTHLVLAATSGGVDVAGLGGQDWRPAFHADNPHLPRWFSDHHQDVSARLPDIRMPVLLLWGDADPLSPVAVGEHLASLLPHAHLHVVPGGDHDLARTHARDCAPLIDRHLDRGI